MSILTDEFDFRKRLSPREIEVLKLVSNGFTNEEIAEYLYISIHTVKKHLETINIKLHTRTRAHATTIGIKMGLI